jgi:protein-disulfide isomerase
VWSVAAVLAIGLPFLWSRYPVIPPLPPDIAALQEPGKITVVGFTDFQCPFCRKLYPDLREIEEQYGDRLRYVRKMMPLAGHPGALPAAKAYLCTPEAKRDAAAALLYTARPDQLTDDGVAGLLAPIGVEPGALAACMSASATKATLDADMAMYERLAARGLPLTYAGDRVIMGYNPGRIRDALARASAPAPLSLPLPWMFVALAAVAVGALALDARARERLVVGGDAGSPAVPS